jgi:hypothetical protein
MPPACPKCNQPRTFELQVMPCVFDIIDELRLVDWQTVAIYTCSNPDCVPNFAKDEFYEEEFAYIQFSEDFKNVRYGDESQIAEQKRRKAEELARIEKECEEDPEYNIIKQEAMQEAEKNPKKKNKKKKKEEGPTKEEINSEVQEELGDLLSSMNLGGNKK